MAVPKRRVSSARRDKRRSNVWKLEFLLALEVFLLGTIAII